MLGFRNSRFLICAPTTLALIFVLGSCTEKNIDHNLADIRAKVDGARRCAPLLDGSWPIEFSNRALSGRNVNALVEAGLVRRVQATDPERTRIEITPLGQADIVIKRLDENTPATVVLCYGQRQLVSVLTEKGEVADASKANIGKVVSYNYRIVKPPKWTERAEIRAAFPFMVNDLTEIHRDDLTKNVNLGPDKGNFAPE